MHRQFLTYAIVFIAVSGCVDQPEVNQIAGVPQIYGGMENNYPLGELSTLRLASPDSEVHVAVRYPRPIDTGWYPGFGESGNGDEDTEWVNTYKVRFQDGGDPKELTIKWEYSSLTRKLSFANKEFDLPQGKLAILGFDTQMQPTCEFRDATDQNITQLKKELGDVGIEALPAKPTKVRE